MVKANLKFGGKSGILPAPRAIFKRNPIRPQTEAELKQQSQFEQGYAEGIPEPRARKGLTFPRAPVAKTVVTVQERIANTIDQQAAKDAQIDTSKLSSPDQIWQLKKNEIRRQHLREAYLVEEKRLARIEELKLKQHAREQQEEALKNDKSAHEESYATKLTLPTIDSYLKGPIMRQRTAEEKEILFEQRLSNRKHQELSIAEQRAIDVLDLYHAAAEFITTEAELEQAIKEAFEINVGKFESKQMAIENKLSGHSYAISNQGTNEEIIMDTAFGEINGQPGLDSIESTLDGEIEKLRLEAQLMASKLQE